MRYVFPERSRGSRHDAVWSDQRKEDSHEHVRDIHDQGVDFHWNGGANQPRELLAVTTVTGSTVESIDSTGLSMTVQTAWAETSCLCWS